MENKTQFRSAGFGGFNRQDVLNYIEQTAAETAQQLEELRRPRAGGYTDATAKRLDHRAQRASGAVQHVV